MLKRRIAHCYSSMSAGMANRADGW